MPQHPQRTLHPAQQHRRHPHGHGPRIGTGRRAGRPPLQGPPPDAQAAGLTVGQLARQRRGIHTGGFTTPVLTLDADALAHNLAALGTYAARHDLAFAPHGKTCMSPQLFRRQLEHGAWGITAAVPHQARVYRAFGIQRIFLANELVDPAALRWVADELAADPDFRFVCYVDSVRGVRLMDRALQDRPAARIDVVVELGAGEGARTGARTDEDCRAVADAVAATDTLRLVGIAGYEAEVPDADPARVHAYLRRLTALAVEFDKAGRYPADLDEIVVSAGGSSWFDAVADVFAELPELSRPTLRLLRSGAYVSHDHGWYTRLTPSTATPKRAACAPRSASGRKFSPAPPPPRPSSTPASATSPTTSACPRPNSSATPSPARSGPPPGSASSGSPTSTPGWRPTPPKPSRSATGWPSACPTPARSSRSGR